MRRSVPISARDGAQTRSFQSRPILTESGHRPQAESRLRELERDPLERASLLHDHVAEQYVHDDLALRFGR